MNDPMASYLDLGRGQQCVRDLFLALRENLFCWPDVFSLLCFQVVEETKCGNPRCNQLNSTTQPPQLNIELDVPPPGTDLSYLVEQELGPNFNDVEGYHCEAGEGGCGEIGTAGHRTFVHSIQGRDFLIVILRRMFQRVLGGYDVNTNKVTATGDIRVVDNSGNIGYFDPIAVIDHIGSVSPTGDSDGHYLCDIKTKEGKWMHTDDNRIPIEIRSRKVTKQGTVVLYHKRE